MIKVGLLCCFLLLINAAMVYVVCLLLNNVSPALFADPRVLQAAMYFTPIALICVEFWIYDRRTDYLARAKQRSTAGRSELAEPKTSG